MSGRWLTPLTDLKTKKGDRDPRAIGGKAARLGWLQDRGFPIPETWVLPAEAFRNAMRALPPGYEPRSLLRASTPRLLYARTEEAHREILRLTLPRDIEAELAEFFAKVSASAPWGLAVRSSATCEDGALVSMAGLADTKLGVRSKEELVEAVKYVWASLASARALSYLASHGVRDVSMAVVIQRVVQARAAGVLFTQAPNAGHAGERLVNATLGLGHDVVGGQVEPDVWYMKADGRVSSVTLATKESPTAKGTFTDAPALRESDLRELSDYASKLEGAAREPWDVEFVCDESKLWIVQARPVTGRGFPDGGNATTIWTNANVGEALPGVATPLTWSVAGAFSEAGFRSAFATLGCSVPRSAKLVANVQGRFYLNLSQFLRISAQVPWLDPNTLLSLGGVGDPGDLTVPPVSRRQFYSRLPLTATRLVREQLRLDDMVNRFEEFAERAKEHHRSLDLGVLPDEGVAKTLRDLQALLERTGTVMLTSASSSLGANLALRMLVARALPDDAERLAQALTAGIRDLESARPALGMARVAKVAKGDPEARAIIEQGITRIEQLPEGPTRRALAHFLELYGDRAVREAELSTPRWKEDQTHVLTMLRVALREGPRTAEGAETAFSRAREGAAVALEELSPKLGLATAPLLRHLVARTQKGARLRERMRSWVTTVLGLIREAALEANRRLVRLMPDLETEPEFRTSGGPRAIESVFFLTIDEVMQALQTARADLGPVVRSRRGEYLRDVQRPDPPPTFTGAPPPIPLPPAQGHELPGVAASGGVVEGIARVLSGAEQMGDFLPGEVLVVQSTDVGWTPLFPLAAGVVTQLGGALSHAAIVAREFRVPSVVNVADVTRIIKTGERIRVDGDRGRVVRLS
ncbi:MAG: PEP/pyruvate-binding domain-containing protein [Polyangiaceae bacterium]